MSLGELWPLLQQGLWDTLYMTVPATVLSYLIGMPLGVMLVVTRRDHIMPRPALNAALGAVVNFLRSIPFIILLCMLFPVTRLVMGRAIGTRAIIFPLVVCAFPYVARMAEGALSEVDRGIIEAAQSMGSTNRQIITKVLIPEALPSLLNGAAISMVNILGYTAMASAAGGGGLGSIAIIKGINIRRMDVMYAASILLVLLVQVITVTGTGISKKTNHKQR